VFDRSSSGYVDPNHFLLQKVIYNKKNIDNANLMCFLPSIPCIGSSGSQIPES
jgi:hypothetical protein